MAIAQTNSKNVGRSVPIPVGSIIEDRWIVQRNLGEGNFGAVYEVEDKLNFGTTFALKLEALPQSPSDPPRVLPLEVTVLRALRTAQAKHAPCYVSCGFTDKFNYVVMSLVGKNMNELRKQMPEAHFTLKTCLYTGQRCLICLEEFQDAGFIHRDIKPANICVGLAPADLRSIYILDWGLCRRYLNNQGNIHRPRIKASFRGTPRYASLRSLHDLEQCRADDTWSWFLCLIEFTIGRLPWDDERGPNDPDAYLPWLAKTKTAYLGSSEKMCQGCPSEYKDVHASLSSTSYYDRPKYNELNQLLGAIMQNNHFNENQLLDWEIDEKERLAESEMV